MAALNFAMRLMLVLAGLAAVGAIVLFITVRIGAGP